MSLSSILKSKPTPEKHHKELEAEAANEEAVISKKVTMPDGTKATMVQIDLTKGGGDIGEALSKLLGSVGIKPKDFAEGVAFVEGFAREAHDAVVNAKLTEKQRDLIMLGFSENFRRFAGCVINGHTTATEEQCEAVAKMADAFFDYGNEKEHLGKSDYLAMLSFILD